MLKDDPFGSFDILEPPQWGPQIFGTRRAVLRRALFILGDPFGPTESQAVFTV